MLDRARAALAIVEAATLETQALDNLGKYIWALVLRDNAQVQLKLAEEAEAKGQGRNLTDAVHELEWLAERSTANLAEARRHAA